MFFRMFPPLRRSSQLGGLLINKTFTGLLVRTVGLFRAFFRVLPHLRRSLINKTSLVRTRGGWQG